MLAHIACFVGKRAFKKNRAKGSLSYGRNYSHTKDVQHFVH